MTLSIGMQITHRCCAYELLCLIHENDRVQYWRAMTLFTDDPQLRIIEIHADDWVRKLHTQRAA